MTTIKTTTTLGTPCSANWDETWIAYVDAVEADLGQRICGARTRTGDCCCMDPTHSNGRCRFHGGFDAYGGKEGNAHALRHGLYSFRLRPCSAKCPQPIPPLNPASRSIYNGVRGR